MKTPNTSTVEDGGCRHCAHIRNMMDMLVCGFCGKPHEEIQFLVAGPICFICNECVDLACGIIAQGWKDKADSLDAARKKDAEAVAAWAESPEGKKSLTSM